MAMAAATVVVSVPEDAAELISFLRANYSLLEKTLDLLEREFTTTMGSNGLILM